MQQFPHIRHGQCLHLLCYLHQNIMQKKSGIFKKRHFLGQALDFLPPRKPGLYISLVHFFFFEYHEQTLRSGQNLSKPVKIRIFLTKSRNLLSRRHSSLMLLLADAQYLITNFMVISYNKRRRSHSQIFFKIAVLKNFATFAWKHLWWILFLINFFNKNTYFRKHLRAAAFEI